MKQSVFRLTFLLVVSIYSIGLSDEKPWGTIQTLSTFLEPDEKRISLINPPSIQTVWYFGESSLEGVRDLLIEVGISESTSTQMLEKAVVIPGDQIRIFPSVQTVESLSPQGRAKLYSELRKYSRNERIISPMIIDSGDFEGWFRSSQLGKEDIERFKKLSYRLGSFWGFSDLPVALSHAADDQKERTLLKAEKRTRTLFVTVNFSPLLNLESVKTYWTGHGLYSRNLAVIDSALNKTGDTGKSLDIAYLLPTFPRRLLYTYPVEALATEGVYPDSIWTAFHFFSDSPMGEFKSQDSIENHLAEFYEKATSAPRFGDVFLLADENGKYREASVSIVEGIIFTKGGRSIYQPFILLEKDIWLEKEKLLKGTLSLERWRLKKVAR